MARNYWQISRGLCAALCMASASFAGAATAQDNTNILTRTGAPSEDRLVIDQSTNGGHTAGLHLQRKQSILLSEGWARNTASRLQPGRVSQTDSAHILTASLSGMGHQLAVRQSGQSHRAAVRSQGRGNMVSIAQAGQGNSVSLTQAGTRNSVVITQN